MKSGIDKLVLLSMAQESQFPTVPFPTGAFSPASPFCTSCPFSKAQVMPTSSQGSQESFLTCCSQYSWAVLPALSLIEYVVSYSPYCYLTFSIQSLRTGTVTPTWQVLGKYVMDILGFLSG